MKLQNQVAIVTGSAAGEAGAFPNISGAVSRWFPSTERARAQGVVWGASRLGGIFAPLVVVPVMAAFGWRATFWMLGAVGAVWVLCWFPWYRNSPVEHPGVSEKKRAEIGVAAHAAPTGFPWGQLLRGRQLWLVMLMYQFYCWGAYFYLSWLHTYLVNGRGLTERKMGLRRGRSLLGAAGLLGGAACVLATALTTGKMPSAWAICMDLGGKYSGAVSGAMNSAGHIGGLSSSVLFGYLVRDLGSYNAPLFVIAAMLTLAAVMFSRIDASKPLVAEPASAIGVMK